MTLSFDGQIITDWLNSFSRNIATVDHQGMPIPADTIRYDKRRMIFGLPVPTQLLSGNIYIINGGYNADKSEGRLITQQADHFNLYSVNLSTKALTLINSYVDTTGLGSTRTISSQNILHYEDFEAAGLAGNDIDGVNSLAEVFNAVYANGLFLIFAKKYDLVSGSTFDCNSCLIYYSTDDGNTFTLYEDDSDDIVDEGRLFGATWSNNCVISPFIREEHGRDFWIPFVRYHTKSASSSNDNTESQKDRAYILRAIANNPDSIPILQGILRVNHPLTVSPYSINHQHALVIGEYESNNKNAIRAVASCGDLRDNNVLYSLILVHDTVSYDPTNPEAFDIDFTDINNWTIASAYHGRLGDDDLSSNYGLKAHQFVNWYPGRSMGEIIVTPDVQCDAIDFFSLYDEFAEFSLNSRYQGDQNVFALDGLSSLPMFGKSCLIYQENYSDAFYALYSPDFCDSWIEIDNNDDIRSAISFENFVLVSGLNSYGIKAFDVPENTRVRPAIFSGGGTNLSKNYNSGAYNPISSVGSQHSVTVLEPDEDGDYNDQYYGTSPLPKPPTQLDHIIRCSTLKTGNTAIFNYKPTDLWSEGTEIRKIRLWICNGNHRGSLSLLIRLKDGSNTGQAIRGIGDRSIFIMSQTSAWVPIIINESFTLSPGNDLSIEIRHSGTQNSLFYLTADLCVEPTSADPHFGYALSPNSSSPNEVFEATLPVVFNANKKFRFTAVWPENYNDVGTQASAISYFATLYRDVNNYIRFGYNVTNDTVYIDGKYNSTAFSTTFVKQNQILWGSQLDFQLSLNGTDLNVVARVAGETFTHTFASVAFSSSLNTFCAYDKINNAFGDIIIASVDCVSGAQTLAEIQTDMVSLWHVNTTVINEQSQRSPYWQLTNPLVKG